MAITDLAATAGLTSPTTIYYLEREQHIPRLDTVERLAYALGVSPAWLAYDQGPPHAWVPSDPLRSGAVGERLRQARNRRGLSARELGRLSETSDTTVRLTERGQTVPNLAKLELLADALDVSPAWLAYGYEDRPHVAAGNETADGRNADDA